MGLYGSWSQSLPAGALFRPHPAGPTDVVDPNLRDARGHSAELGIRGKWQDRLRADVSVYTMTYGDRIGNLSRTNADGSSFYRTSLGNSLHRDWKPYGSEPVALPESPYPRGAHAVELARADESDLRRLPARIARERDEATSTASWVEYARRWSTAGAHPFLLGDFRAGCEYSYTGKESMPMPATPGYPAQNGQAGVIPAWTVWDASAGYTCKERYELKVNLSDLFDDRYFTRRSGGYPGPGLLPGEARTLIVTVGMKL